MKLNQRIGSGASGAGVPAARRRGCSAGDPERFVHDAPNGAGAAPALSAATQAVVNLPGRAWNVLARRQRRTHVVVGENVAGAHDHLHTIIAGKVPAETVLG